MADPQRNSQLNLRAAGEYTIGCLILTIAAAIILAVLAVPINWLQDRIVPWMVEHLPWLFLIAELSLALLQSLVLIANLSLVVGVPITLLLLISQRTRRLGLWGLRVYIAVTIFGNIWIGSIIWTINFAGVLWLIIGLLFGTIGVIPIAFVAALLRAEWSPALIIFIGLVLSSIPLLLADRIEARSSEGQKVE